MPAGPAHLAAGITHAEHAVLYDPCGTEIMRFSATEAVIPQPDGADLVVTESDHLVTVDGFVWHLRMLASGPMLAVCLPCRNPPRGWLRHRPATHGLVTTMNAVLCSDCGQALCPKHRHWSADRRFRCPSCHRRAAIGRVLRAIFYVPRS